MTLVTRPARFMLEQAPDLTLTSSFDEAQSAPLLTYSGIAVERPTVLLHVVLNVL